jgi:protein TonB
MDPRWWLLPPLVALGILAAYFMGQRMTPEPAAAPEPVVQQPVMQTPPAPPRGHISVTEVPRAAPAPAPRVPTPRPPVVTPTPPAPASTQPYHQVEPPVVLPPPAPADDTGDGASTAPQQPADDTPAADDTPVEPPRDPVKLNEPALEYPSSAYESGVEGTARVTFTVTAAGKVQDPRITDSSGDSRLDQAAVDYARRLRFRPGTRDGKPADVQVTRSVRFQLH